MARESAPRYQGADRLLADLERGNLDLAAAGERVRSLVDSAYRAGAEAAGVSLREQLGEIRAQNHELRARLVGVGLRLSRCRGCDG